MGWPDPADEYSQIGCSCSKALSERTARVVLVVDDEFAVGNLAVYVAAYAHWGFELLIDGATFLRTGVTRVPVEATEPTAQAQPTHASGCVRHGGGLNVVVRFWRLRLHRGPPPPADACARSCAPP